MPHTEGIATPYTGKEDGQHAKRVIEFVDCEAKKEKNAPNIYTFKDLYSKRGEDLLAYYEKQKKTRGAEVVRDNFLHNVENGTAAQLAEKLPLLANRKGRLGDYVSAKITKTLKQDDQGNSFIDLVVEITNDYVGEVDKDSPRKMTFLVDVSTNTGEKKQAKEYAMQREFLDPARRANVKCYQDGPVLGIERPKVSVAQEEGFILAVGNKLGTLITQHASDSFSISNDEKFDTAYRDYFTDLLKAVSENATASIDYMNDKGYRDKYHRGLIAEYQKIVRFIAAYEKTPAHRVKTQDRG
jgi:hypothetical protein